MRHLMTIPDALNIPADLIVADVVSGEVRIVQLTNDVVHALDVDTNYPIVSFHAKNAESAAKKFAALVADAAL